MGRLFDQSLSDVFADNIVGICGEILKYLCRTSWRSTVAMEHVGSWCALGYDTLRSPFHEFTTHAPKNLGNSVFESTERTTTAREGSIVMHWARWSGTEWISSFFFSPMLFFVWSRGCVFRNASRYLLPHGQVSWLFMQ